MPRTVLLFTYDGTICGTGAIPIKSGVVNGIGTGEIGNCSCTGMILTGAIEGHFQENAKCSLSLCCRVHCGRINYSDVVN